MPDSLDFPLPSKGLYENMNKYGFCGQLQRYGYIKFKSTSSELDILIVTDVFLEKLRLKAMPNFYHSFSFSDLL